MAKNSCATRALGELKISGKVIVHSGDIKKYDLEKYPERAVEQQLLYLNGDIHFGAQAGTNIVLLQGSRIHIKGKQSASYGRSLVIEREAKQVQLNRNDSALVIEYDAEQKIALCSTDPTEKKIPSIYLPLDPYNSFWLVPQAKWEKLSFQGRDLKINPCADNEIVSLHAPERYWYTWNPIKNQHCRDILKPGLDYLVLDGKFVPDQLAPKKLARIRLPDSKQIEMSILFGFVSENEEEKTIADAKNFFKANQAILTKKMPSPEVFTTETSKFTQDAALWAVIDFFSKLRSKMKIDFYSIKESGQFMRFHAIGYLLQSQKKISVDAYLGPSELANANTRSLLSSLLATQNIVFYIGHSAGGKNSNWNGLGESLQAHTGAQFLGIISCYATSFFDIAKSKTKISGMDLLLADFSAYRYLMPLGLVDYLDQAQKIESPYEAFQKYVQDDEVFLLQTL